MGIIFQGDHVTVRVQDLGSAEAVTTFTQLYADNPPPALGFGETFFSKNNISGIYFIAK